MVIPLKLSNDGLLPNDLSLSSGITRPEPNAPGTKLSLIYIENKIEMIVRIIGWPSLSPL